ncbi:MAG: cobalamin B12-binding domain-containing protein [Chloroflexi bacterium]|nr:cobalamin B12-binding domain-containing protein [Chloroflexota bacterium]
MKVVLINPKFHLPIDTRKTPHLGLAYLAAVSERRGDEVYLYDADVEDEPLAEFIQRVKPDLVGITSNTPQVKQAWRTADAIKSVWDVPVVIGGPHPSVLPEESAAKPGIDIVVEGEGEETWIDISDRLERYKRDVPEFKSADLLSVHSEVLEPIYGITYQTSDGRMHRNPERPPIMDLDSLPFPAYRFFKMDRYSSLQPAMDAVNGARSFSMMTSRGCPYRCTFCSQSIMPIKWRARSPENVVAEYRHLIRELGAEEIGWLDDSANIRVKRMHEICDLLMAEGLNTVPWIMINGIRANLADEVTLRKMKDAGCKRLAFGVETGDEDMLVSIDKRIDHDTIRQAFKNAKKVGLETMGFFIIGLPGDTEQTIEKTIKFAIEVDPLVANFSMMTPYPGTTVYEIATKKGRMLMKDWEDYVFFEGKARYELGDMTAELVERKWKEAYRRFYLRPSRVAKTLTRAATWKNLPRTVGMAFKVVFPRATKDELKPVLESASVAGG